MDRGWNDTTCYGPERSRLGQQPYDRGRIAPTDRRSCFECGQEGHISRYCPRYLDRISGGVYSRWPSEHWPPARPPTSFHKESSYSRGENNREISSYGRRAPFDGHDQGEMYYRPRDGGDRGRDNESSRVVDMGVTSNANVRERESRSSRSSVRKPHDGSHQTSVGHRRDEQKGGKGDLKDEGKDGKSQRVEKHIEAKICTSSDCVVTGEGNGEIQRGGQVSKSSPRGPYSAVEAIGKHGIPVAEDGARASTKDVDHHKPVSGSDLRGSVTDKDRCRRYENGGKRGQKHSKEEPARINDGSSSRSSSKVPLSVLCSKAIENGVEGVANTKACLDSTSLNSAPKIETALPLCSPPGHKKELKDGVHTERRETDVSSTSLHQDSLPQDVNDVGKIRTCDDTPNLSKSDLPVGVDFPKAGHGDKEREVVVQAFVSADTKRPSVCDEGQSKSGKGRRATRWDTPKASPRVDNTADYPRSRDRFERSAVSSKETAADAIQDADKSKRKDAVKEEKPTVSSKDTVAAAVLQQSEVLDRMVFVKEEKGSRNKDPTGDASEGVGRKPPSGKGGAEQDNKRSDCDTSQPCLRGAGKDGSDGERDPSMVHTGSGPSSWYRRRGQFRERNHEPDWREQDSGFDGREREWDVDRHVNCFERGAEKEPPRKLLEQGSLSPSRTRNDSRERDSTNDAFTGYRSREVSVEIFSDKNGQAIYTERAAQKPTLKTLNGGLKPEYRRRFETIDGRNGCGNTLALEYREVEDGREEGGCGAEWRHSRSMEAQPLRSQFKHPYANLIGAHYSCVVNARCEAHRSPSPMAISPPLCQVSASRQDPLPSSQGEETSCIIREPLSTGWLYNDRHGNLQGPVDLGQLREMFGSGLLQADHLVCREGTNEWITLEHAGSPANCLPSSPGNKLLSSLSSSGISQASPQSYHPCTQVRLKDDHLAVEHADNDIYPPRTGISNDNSVDRDFEDLRIDERVEKLMQGFTYIPGKEGEAVYACSGSICCYNSDAHLFFHVGAGVLPSVVKSCSPDSSTVPSSLAQL